jgi:hypothetical protein
MKGYGLELYTRDYPQGPPLIIPWDTFSIPTEKHTMIQSHSIIPEVFLDIICDQTNLTINYDSLTNKRQNLTFLQNLIVVQIIKKSPSFYGPRR